MKWLKDIRLNSKLTQLQVAIMSNISLSFYCQIENGVRNPSVSKAKRIAKALNFDWQKFYEDEEK